MHIVGPTPEVHHAVPGSEVTVDQATLVQDLHTLQNNVPVRNCQGMMSWRN